MRRRIYGLLAVAAMLLGVVTSAAEAVELELPEPEPPKQVEPSETGSYIVVMEEEPVVAEVGQDGLGTPEAEALAEELEASHDEVLQEEGIPTADKVQAFTTAINGFSAKLSHDEAMALAANGEVLLVVPDEFRQLTSDSSPEFLDLTGGQEAHGTGVTGKGVVVGVIDSGIWPEHPSFADNGLPAPPVTLEDTPENPACNFGNTAHNPADAPFTCNNKLVGARQMLSTYRTFIGAEADEFDSARDDDGHGTHVASTAAGNADVEAEIFGRSVGRGPLTGIAPDAHVIAYKGLGNLGGFTSDLVSAIDQAVADDVDVINYSVGGGPGVGSLDALAFLLAYDAGVYVATSAGNSGPGPATIGGPADVPWITTVGASTQPRFFEGQIRLGNGKKYEGASITQSIDRSTDLIDAADAGGDLCLPGTLDPAAVDGKIVLCRRGAVARVAKSDAVFQAGGAGMILYNVDDVGDLITDTHWVPSVHVDLTEGLAVKEYIASSSNPTAKLITGRRGSWKNAPTMASFSSRGPNPSVPDVIKPDLTAPGVQILAGASPYVDPGSVPGELFQSIAGTSMSSPHVAGVYALIKQVNPDWTPGMAKSAIMTTADQKVKDNDRSSQADPFGMGAGHLDPGRVKTRGSVFNPGLVYDSSSLDHASISCTLGAGFFSPAFCDLLASSGFPTDPSELNLASIGIADLAGTETVTRTVTNVADRTHTYVPKIDAPDGYEVTVNPRRLRPAPGESVSYTVTVTNDGTGVPGEWSFGSISWNTSAGYKVRSPLAVKGALFDAPGSIAGSGPSGSAAFDVSFGYSGDYTAAPHGLVAETVTSDTVVQDPDQSFSPSDGFSNAHQFDLTGVAFFRIEMPPEATEADADLDIYVLDPGGSLVASSTSGGTDELIEIALPAAGTWTVYVHGWATIGPDSDYDLSTWAVPAAPGGGSLAIDAAPTSASLGTTESVAVSWSGLSAGEDYLGAVSHSDGSGIIGFTLVEVAG